MSIRVRLVIMCVVVALLPAVPVSVLVETLIEKSFHLGLNPTVEDALQSGLSVSRTHLGTLHANFENAVDAAVARLSGGRADSTAVAHALAAGTGIDGFLVGRAAPSDTTGRLPGTLAGFAGNPGLALLIDGKDVLARTGDTGIHFYYTDDRSLLLALWSPRRDVGAGAREIVRHGADRTGRPVLFYKRTDPEFMVQARRILEGRQIFAQLRLEQPVLSRSFFYPFMLIYGVILLLSLAWPAPDIDRSAVEQNDVLHHRQSETASLGLRREVRIEYSADRVGFDPRPVVRDRQHDVITFPVQTDGNLRMLGVLQCRHGVVHEIDNDAPHLIGIETAVSDAGIRVDADRNLTVEPGDIRDHRLERSLARLEFGQPGKRGELFDQRLEMIDLFANDPHALVDELSVRGVAALVLVPELLHRQPYRQQRVLDLMREVPRDLAPGCHFLHVDQPAALGVEPRHHVVERRHEVTDFSSRAHTKTVGPVTLRDDVRALGEPPDRVR
ncbi:MAG: hypothetical protein P8181_15100, partial [bacterium]